MEELQDKNKNDIDALEKKYMGQLYDIKDLHK